MLTEEEFSALLHRMEDETLDFKRNAYNLSKGHYRYALIKDVLCMANTPRDTNSYIILGVKKYPNGLTDLLGLDHHADEADMQAQFSDRVTPVPHFRYEIVSHRNKKFGVIIIPPNKLGPCVPTKDHGNALRHKQIYFRQGSKNEVAGPDDVKRICEWIESSDARTLPNIHPPLESLEWQRLVEATDTFSPSRRFMLITDIRNSSNIPKLDMLGSVHWSYVVDLDPYSEQSGLLKYVRHKVEENHNIHMVLKGDRPTLNLDQATYWTFARGLAGSRKALTVGSWREWQQQYGNDLREQISNVAKAAQPAPIAAIVAWYGEGLIDYLQSILEAMLQAMGSSIDFIVVTDDTAEVHSVASKFDAKIIPISLHHICFGLQSLLESRSSPDTTQVILPSSSGAPISVETSDSNWIAEEIELIHLGSGRARSNAQGTTGTFLTGNEITWGELALRYDVDRDQYRRLLRQLELDLHARRSVRINLYHEPGAGGTTVARRAIWDLHEEYPCGVLRRSAPKETIERLQKIIRFTDQPAILLADGGDVSSRELDELYQYIQAQHLPVVMLQVLRRYNSQHANQQISRHVGERVIRLSSQLSVAECDRFVHKLSQEAPKQREALNKIAKTNESRLHTPFYYCLEAFGANFRRLDSYVSSGLSKSTPDQKKILAFLAIAHHYGQKPIPAQAFGHLIGIPANRPVELLRALPERALDLVVESGKGAWRTSHDLIATEILRQLLWPSSSDRDQWRQNLSAWATDFARFCRGNDPMPSDAMLEVARRTFVYRDNVDLLGTERSATSQFAQLITDIPVREGRLEVMRALAEEFPDEAHFMAHLGRFYEKEMRDFQKAVDCVDRALSLQPDESSIHHMKGMALRSQANSMIEHREPLTAVIDIAKQASTSFDLSREKDPDNEHGYISEVQLRSRLLDYAGRQQPGGLLEYLKLPSADPFIRNSLDMSEDLLEQVRRNREGHGPSSYEQDCRGKLDRLYGRHDQALQIWDNMLHRNDVYSPPIRRQIVWTYLARKSQSWENLTATELVRARGLIEANLDEEPNNDRDMRMWVQIARRVPHPPSIESVIEKISYWKANSGSIDATYYLYVFNAILALEGSVLSLELASQYLEECRSRARLRRNRTKSFEWVGPGVGLSKVVHQSRLGDWDRTSDFWMDVRPLSRVTGRISRIRGSEAGHIEVAGGMSAFFVPAKGGYALGRSENQAVEFYLGFSYEGLRAWDVKSV